MPRAHDVCIIKAGTEVLVKVGWFVVKVPLVLLVTAGFSAHREARYFSSKASTFDFRVPTKSSIPRVTSAKRSLYS